MQMPGYVDPCEHPNVRGVAGGTSTTPSASRVTVLVIPRFSRYVPGATCTWAPGGAASSAAWIDPPGATSIVVSAAAEPVPAASSPAEARMPARKTLRTLMETSRVWTLPGARLDTLAHFVRLASRRDRSPRSQLSPVIH